MPDNVATPPADAPAPLSQEQITEQAVTLGLEAAAREDAPPVIADPDAPPADTPPTDDPPAADPPADTPPTDEPPADTPSADEPPAEAPPEPLTDEQQDEADAKSLGFKNQKATAEFKAQRAELRELRPLKDAVAALEPLAQRWEKVYGYLQANNIDADRFAQGMAMIAGTESKDPDIIKRTIGGLEMEADRLRQKIGLAGGAYDPLKEPGNADLARAVDEGEITPQLAAQQAQLRAENTHRATLESTQRESQQQQHSLNQARAEAIAGLDAVGAEYAALDPNYQQKADILVASLKPVFARLPPDQWVGVFRQAYTELRLPANVGIAEPARLTVTPLRNQPLRPSAPAANQQPAITTEEDAFAAGMRAAAAADGVPYRGP